MTTYALHLETWWQYFPRDRLFIVLLEDFQHNPFQVMEQILAFLKLPPFDYQSLSEKNNRGLWVIRGQVSKGNTQPYEPIPATAKALLDEYYLPWNQKLRYLLPALNISW